MLRPARGLRKATRRFAGSLASIVLAVSIAAPVLAEPLTLSDSSSLDRLAALVEAYRDTSRVRWVVEASDPALRVRVLEGLTERLAAVDPSLVERVTATDAVASTRSLPSPEAGNEPVAHAYINILPPPDRGCSWRVTVRDDAAPGADVGGVAIPLERGDTIPTSSKATLEVGFSGPLQSTLYAFAETQPGSLRDLAAAPEIAIPVEPSGEETLVLVRARRPVPFLDGLRAALVPAAGGRESLGKNAALGERFRNGGRGIGANIQLLDPEMVVAMAEPQPNAPPTPPAADSDQPLAKGDLVETCLYTVTRLP